MKKLFTLLTLLVAMVTSAWADTETLGITMSHDDETKTWGAPTFTGTTNVDISQVCGSKCNIYTTGQTNRKPQIDGVAYTCTSGCFRKTVNSSNQNDDQYIGFKLTIADGYKINLSKVNARIYVADDTYGWNVQIFNSNGVNIYKSADKQAKKASADLLSEALYECDGLTGNVEVRMYMWQGGSQKYFAVDQLTVDVEVLVDASTKYDITTSMNIDGAGTINPAVGISKVTEGDDVILTATPNTGYKFLNWEVDGVDVVGNPYTISNVTANHTAIAKFEKLPVVSFAKGEATGIVPATEYPENGSAYKCPTPYFLAKSGATFAGWSDGVNTYQIGEGFTVTGDVTLTATYADNTVALGDEAVIVEWHLGRTPSIPIIAVSDTQPFTVQTTINGKKYDATMTIVRNDGKADNSTQIEDRMQVNGGTVFTIPAVKGMEVFVTYTAGDPVGAMTFGGQAETSVDTDAKQIKYVYNGEAATLDIEDKGNNIYPSAITVAYPGAVGEIVSMNAYEWTTFASAKNLDFTDKDVKAYIVTGHAGSAITTTQVNKVAANTPILLNAVKGLYILPTSYTGAADATTGNLLKAGTGAAVSAEANKTKYALSVEGGKAAFKKIATSATIPAGKAYLEFNEEISAPSLSFDFGGTTGIDEVRGQMEDVRGEYYNLAGQRVAQPTKGLYIVNGKKVILK